MLTFEKIVSVVGTEDAKRYLSMIERRGYLSYDETLDFKRIESRIKRG